MANEKGDKNLEKDQIEENNVTTASIHKSPTGKEWVLVWSAHKEKLADFFYIKLRKLFFFQVPHRTSGIIKKKLEKDE